MVLVNWSNNYGSSIYILRSDIFNKRLSYIFLFVKTIVQNLSQSNDGETPLHYAIQKYWPNITRQLVLAGADLTLKNRHGCTPFMYAVVESFDVYVLKHV